ncbi:hypothetical protein FB451DRAFT_1406286 [Mycena latifolia]|nr:hypothetical protein FB451DRAFT_1406286 [Mycena latifolia]
MSLALTFGDKKLLDSPILGPDGAVCYTTSTTHGFRGRKITTIMAASGLRKWDELKSRSNGIFSSEREWNWANRPYKLKYHNWEKELLVTPSFGSEAGVVRFTPYHAHLLHDNEPAVLYFPHQMDEVERMFLLMAILETEIHRQDQNTNAAVAGAAASAS